MKIIIIIKKATIKRDQEQVTFFQEQRKARNYSSSFLVIHLHAHLSVGKTSFPSFLCIFYSKESCRFPTTTTPFLLLHMEKLQQAFRRTVKDVSTPITLRAWQGAYKKERATSTRQQHNLLRCEAQKIHCTMNIMSRQSFQENLVTSNMVF